MSTAKPPAKSDSGTSKAADAPPQTSNETSEQQGSKPGSEQQDPKQGEQDPKQSSGDSARSRASSVADAQQAVASEVPAMARAATGKDGRGTQGGFMDQLSRRSEDDAMEGHFCVIDRSNGEARQALDDLDLSPSENYGVYQEVVAADPETGIPITVRVRLRGDAAPLVTVPYESLIPAEAGRR